MQISKIILWALAGIGSLAMTAAGIHPDAAVTNLSAWANKIGIDNPPAFLSNPNADDWGMAVGFALVVASLILLWLCREKEAPPNPEPKDQSSASNKAIHSPQTQIMTFGYMTRFFIYLIETGAAKTASMKA